MSLRTDKTTVRDTWKVQAAMTTELDYGVANVTGALKAAGMWQNTVLLFVSDNGGPLDHSTNWPLRGGKGTDPSIIERRPTLFFSGHISPIFARFLPSFRCSFNSWWIGSDWEGGYRVEAFVHSPLLPASVAGTTWDGIAHASDWYVTCVVGIAGGSIPPLPAGVRPTDGHNLCALHRKLSRQTLAAMFSATEGCWCA